jgi:protocatechuate 3,4-dioxygenase beta subunit
MIPKFGVVASALLFASLAAAQTQAQPENQSAQPENQNAPSETRNAQQELEKRLCSIDGIVVSRLTQVPVRNALVSLRFGGDSGPVSYSATTNAAGAFTLTRIIPGRYILSAEQESYVRENYGAHRPTGPGATLVLKDSSKMSDVVLSLTPRGIISGKVTDGDGDPVSGVLVHALRYKYLAGQRRLISTGVIAPTNDLGQYRLANLEPGQYYVVTTSQRVIGAPPPEASGDETAVTQGYAMEYYPNSPNASGAAPLIVTPGSEIAGIDMPLRRTSVYRIKGKVLGAVKGDPMPGVVLMVYPWDTGGMSTVPMRIQPAQGAEARFTCTNIPPGNYTIVAISPNTAEPLVSVTPVTLIDRDVEEVVISLGGGPDIPVTVKFDPASGGTPKDLSGVLVQLRLQENPVVTSHAAQFSKQNTAVLKAVSPEKYTLLVSGLPEGVYLKGATFGDQNVLEAGLDARKAGDRTIELTLARDSAELAAVVRNEKGDPSPGAILTLVPARSQRTDLFRLVTADQQGVVTLKGIVPGEYKIFVWDDVDADAAQDDEFRKPFESKATTVEFPAGSRKTSELTVISPTAAAGQ